MQEENSRAHENNLDSMFDQVFLLNVIPDSIIIVDLDWKLLFWNSSAEQLYGWTFEEAKGMALKDLIAEQDLQKLEEAKRELAKKGSYEANIVQKAKNGRIIVTRSRWVTIKEQDGNVRAYLLVNQDITEQLNLEAQLRRAQRMESLGSLAGGIAHDLNNILAPILMSVQILNSKTSDPEMKKLIASLETSVKRGSEIIKHVLTFAKGAEKDFSLQNLGQIISEVESIVKRTFPRNIELKFGIARDLSRIMGDATQLQQILMNLCINARDAMPEGGRLTVTAQDVYLDEAFSRHILGAKPGKYVMLTVSDTGSGIPYEIQDKVFEPFFTTKAKGKGTGLGLSIVYGIVKSHGGLIKLYSEPGKGTEFKIFFPIADQKGIVAEQYPDQSKKIIRGNGERILVIEDELFALQITKEILELNGYSVLAATDGASAVNIFENAEKGSIPLAITDLNMPTMDGPSTIKALRKLDKNIKIIVSSGLFNETSANSLTGLEIQGYLTKPYTAEQLLLMVQKALGKDS